MSVTGAVARRGAVWAMQAGCVVGLRTAPCGAYETRGGARGVVVRGVVGREGVWPGEGGRLIAGIRAELTEESRL